MRGRQSAGLAVATLAALALACLAAGDGPALPFLRIVYTVDTLGQLDTCGCSGGQHGGLPRRRSAIWNLHSSEFPLVALDGGHVAESAKQHPYLAEAYALMGYRLVVAEDASEAAAFRERSVGAVERGSRVSVETVEVDGVTLRVLVAGGGEVPIEAIAAQVREARGAAGGAMSREGEQGAMNREGEQGAMNRAPTVLITALSFEANARLAELLGDAVDVVFGASGPARTRDYRDPIPEGKAIPSISQGKALTVVDVFLEADGSRRVEARFEPVAPSLLEDGAVKAIVERYYREAAPASRPAAEEEDRSEDWAARGWVSPATCGECHPDAYQAWLASEHAQAVPTLRERERLVDECLACHSEEYRRSGAFDPERAVPGDGVACSTCHGTGLAHVATEGRRPLAQKPDEAMCRTCHNEERQPAGFDYAASWTTVEHRM